MGCDKMRQNVFVCESFKEILQSKMDFLKWFRKWFSKCDVHFFSDACMHGRRLAAALNIGWGPGLPTAPRGHHPGFTLRTWWFWAGWAPPALVVDHWYKTFFQYISDSAANLEFGLTCWVEIGSRFTSYRMDGSSLCLGFTSSGMLGFCFIGWGFTSSRFGDRGLFNVENVGIEKLQRTPPLQDPVGINHEKWLKSAPTALETWSKPTGGPAFLHHFRLHCLGVWFKLSLCLGSCLDHFVVCRSSRVATSSIPWGDHKITLGVFNWKKH